MFLNKFLMSFFAMIFVLYGTIAKAQTEILAIEFVQDDQDGFDLWPGTIAGNRTTADFMTDGSVTSGTTSVVVDTSSGFGTPGNRGSADGNPDGYSYQHLYEDLLHATGPSGFLTLTFSGLNPTQTYTLTLYAWDPGAGDASDKVWTVTDGSGEPASASVNFQDLLIDNETFAMVFEITATVEGTFQLTNTSGTPQSAINGFTLTTTEIDPNAPPVIVSQPQAVWDGAEEFTIEVEVSGAEPFSFQWYLDGGIIAGADEESLTLNAAAWNQNGDYTVRVTNANGFVESEPSAITIEIPEFPTREQLTYEPLGPSSRRSGITISEILYHPAKQSDGSELEFIELYNSQPWAEDISGWRLSGDIDLIFPSGTSVPALGYFVVARVPADVESHYGITGIAGPWSNNLPNDGGRIRLRKPSDAIVQEVNYDDRAPWPAAADGAGHSLVLARASYGENDVRAWAASHDIGGSPGSEDFVPADKLDHVFVSAVLSNSEPPLEDYFELGNAAPFSVDLSGCTLSDARDTLALFTIPAGTSIPANGTHRFTETELGFALSSQGDAIYLTNSDGIRVLDAVQLPATATDVILTRLRSDAPLRATSTPSVVINEIMFHPPTHDNADEWIELHNPGQIAVDLSGWAMTDGIDFVFPSGTQIAAGGFLVVAKDRTRTLSNHPALDSSLVLGDYAGSLSDGGERLVLSRIEGLEMIAEDIVTYTDSDRYHRFADGRGATLERLDASANSFGASNWVDSDESAKSDWTSVEFFGTLAHGNSAAPANQVQMFLLGAGEALVDQVEVIPEGGSNVVPNGDFESETSGWFFQGNHRDSGLEIGGAFEGSNSLRLIATKRGDPGPNRARAPLSQTLASGTRASIRAKVRWLAGHPEFLVRLKGNWLEAPGRLQVPTNLGTPGAINSRAVVNAGPNIDCVSHRPLLPQAGEEIHVFAQITDADGVGDLAVKYRIDPSATTVSVTMSDDGLGADLSPNDGVFSATIPAQGNGSLLAFQIVAEDAMASPATAVFPPSGECLVRVGEPASGPSFGTYRMWITQASRNDWDSQPYRANNPYPITFIYNDVRAVYAAGGYYSGNRDSHSDPLSGSVGYDVALPANEVILGSDKLTLDFPVRDPTNQREQLMHWFADQLKLPTLHRRDIYLYMNGTRRRTIYHDAEQPDGVLANSHFPGNKGELFKTSNDNETSDSGVRVRPFVRNVIDVFEADGEIRPARYRWTTGARARGSRTRLDDTTIIDLMRRADATGADYEQDLLEIIDMENWMRTFALIDLASFWDAFGNPNWKNTYLYKPDGGKWVQFTWDFDVGLGVFNDPTNQALFPGNVDTNIRRMYQTPAFVREYWRAMEESLGSFFSGPGVSSILELKRAAYQAAELNFTSPFSPSGPYNLPVTTWIDRRGAFIQPQLNAVNSSFVVGAPLDNTTTDEQSITLSGTAPVGAVTLEVNGIPLDLNWTSVSAWNAPFVLRSGENLLLIRALGSDGIEIDSILLTVTYTGSDLWPDLVINEWMASNQSALADPSDGDFDDWIELYNPGAVPADLSGWYLSDDSADPFKFQIPDGFGIPAGGFLLVWADQETAQNDLALRPDLHVAFKLGAGGESILLSAPDGTLIDRVDFEGQSPDKTMGKSQNEVVALANPTPGEINGRPAVSPVTSLTLDGSLVTLAANAEPGFLYIVEVSEDLLGWKQIGGNIPATDNVVTITVDVGENHLFYRFRRIP
jgi:hypothetical protein